MTCNPSTWEEKKDRLKDILRYKVSLRLAWTPGTLSQKHLKKKKLTSKEANHVLCFYVCFHNNKVKEPKV